MKIKTNSVQKRFYNTKDPRYLRYEKNIPYASYLVGKMLSVIPRPRQRILEIGAGQGRFTLELARHVGSLHATDLSKREIDILTNHSRGRITTQVVDMLSFQDSIRGIYDHIVGFFVLHHIDRREYPRVVSRLSKHLTRRGGRLTFIEPNNLYPFHVVEMAIEPDMHWGIEKQIYSDYLGRWARSCEGVGLKRVVVKKFGFIPPPLINRWPQIVIVDRFIERIPLVSDIFCPFVLVSYSLV